MTEASDVRPASFGRLGAEVGVRDAELQQALSELGDALQELALWQVVPQAPSAGWILATSTTAWLLAARSDTPVCRSPRSLR